MYDTNKEHIKCYKNVQESENDLGFADVELKQIIARNGFMDITVRNPVETKATAMETMCGAWISPTASTERETETRTYLLQLRNACELQGL